MEHTFEASLKSGQSFENELMDELVKYFTVKSTQTNGKDSRGDIYLNPIPGILNPFNETEPFLAEGKQDCTAWETDQTGHEIYRLNRAGIYKPAGLTATQAKYYIYGYSHRPDVWFIETEKLIQLIENDINKERKNFTGDGAKDSTIAIFDFDVLHSHSTFLFNRPSFIAMINELKSGTFADNLLKRTKPNK